MFFPLVCLRMVLSHHSDLSFAYTLRKACFVHLTRAIQSHMCHLIKIFWISVINLWPYFHFNTLSSLVSLVLLTSGWSQLQDKSQMYCLSHYCTPQSYKSIWCFILPWQRFFKKYMYFIVIENSSQLMWNTFAHTHSVFIDKLLFYMSCFYEIKNWYCNYYHLMHHIFLKSKKTIMEH